MTAASDLGNIPPWDQLWYWLAGIGILCLLGCAAAVAIDGWHAWRSRPRARPAAPPAVHPVDAPTQAISMRDIVVRPQLEDICPGFCDNLGQPGDPQACTCLGPCGRDWCTRKREQWRNPVPVTWADRERGIGREAGDRANPA